MGAQPPAVHAALAGATVIANLSASNITVGKARTRTLLCQSLSARCLCAYIYAAAGEGESTTDVAWDGQTSIFENGATLAQSERFPTGLVTLLADVDLDLLRQERLRMGTFADNRAHAAGQDWRRIDLVLVPPATDLGLRRAIPRFPFVPSDAALLDQDCYEAFTIQVTALKRRVLASRAKTLVIGVSGGLDSTHALLVAARAADECGLGRQAVLGYTMPGFGTSSGTRDNAHELMAALGVQAREIDIRPAARLMLEQMGHPFARGEAVYDVTFENVQAGLRTDFLFRLANQSGGIVIGTGDLSELALGWCTYGVGDQMAHYNVNAGLPKTLIQHLIRWVMAHGRETARTCTVLDAILATEISPELVPATAAQAVQSTESLIGLTHCMISRCFMCCVTDSVPPRSPLWRCTHGGCHAGGLAPGIPRCRQESLYAGGNPALAGGFPQPFLWLQPVQAFGHAQRAKGAGWWRALATRRLARAVGWQCPNLDRGTGKPRSVKLNQFRSDSEFLNPFLTITVLKASRLALRSRQHGR